MYLVLTIYRSMLPVPPNVAPTISLELDVDDGEVENYEVGQTATATFSQECYHVM